MTHQISQYDSPAATRHWNLYHRDDDRQKAARQEAINVQFHELMTDRESFLDCFIDNVIANLLSKKDIKARENSNNPISAKRWAEHRAAVKALDALMQIVSERPAVPDQSPASVLGEITAAAFREMAEFKVEDRA